MKAYLVETGDCSVGSSPRILVDWSEKLQRETEEATQEAVKKAVLDTFYAFLPEKHKEAFGKTEISVKTLSNVSTNSMTGIGIITLNIETDTTVTIS